MITSARPFGLLVVATACLIAAAPDVTHAAAAKKAGGSGLSGTLSSNANIRRQQLICDPDEPLFGSTSTQYDPSLVTLIDFGYGPGYERWQRNLIEVIAIQPRDARPVLVDLETYLTVPQVFIETGYVQVTYQLVGTAGQLPTADGYTEVAQAGPIAIDTHEFLFEALPSTPEDVFIPYRNYADDGRRGLYLDSFMVGEPGDLQTIPFDEIAEARLAGPLIPEPSGVVAVFVLTLFGLSPARRRDA